MKKLLLFLTLLTTVPFLTYGDTLRLCFKNSAWVVAKIFVQGNSHIVAVGEKKSFTLPINNHVDVQYRNTSFHSAWKDIINVTVVPSGGSLKTNTITSGHTLKLKGTISQVYVHDRGWEC